MRSREPAICLKTTDYSETSQVVHFLARNSGVVRLLAKGTKRPKSKSGGAIDLLSEGDLVFTTTGRETLGTLIEFSESVSRTELRKNAQRLNIALYAIELVGNMLPEGDPHVEVFDLLHNCLVRLAQADAPLPAVLAYLQWRLIRHVGLLGELNSCVSCSRDLSDMKAAPDASLTKSGGDLYFSSVHGGLLCPACEGAATEKYRLDSDALCGIAALHAVENGVKGISLPEKQAKAVNRLLSYHITHQLGKPMKMARYAIG